MKTSHCPGKLMQGMAAHTSCTHKVLPTKLHTTGPRHVVRGFWPKPLPGTVGHSLTHSLARRRRTLCVEYLVLRGGSTNLKFYHHRQTGYVGWYKENSSRLRSPDQSTNPPAKRNSHLARTKRNFFENETLNGRLPFEDSSDWPEASAKHVSDDLQLSIFCAETFFSIFCVVFRRFFIISGRF